MKENSTIKQLKEKLKSYSALAGAIVASGATANADILYSNPNTLINTDGSSFEIDLNCDGTNDLKINLSKNGPVQNGIANNYSAYGEKGTNSLTASAFGNLSIAATSSSYLYVEQFANVVPIGSSAYWLNAISKMGKNIQSSYYIFTSSTFGQFFYNPQYEGPWAQGTGGANRYLGLRIGTVGNYHYGWAKIAIGVDLSSVTLVEYAMNEIVNQPIQTGLVNGFANTATSISVLDSTDNDNASDLAVKFTLADTAATGTIRAIAFKTADATGFDVCDAWVIPSTNYVTIAKNSGVAGKYVANFSEKNDGNGNPIVNGENYTVFIYTKGKYDYTVDPNSILSNRAVVVQSINNVTLYGVAEPISALTLADTANNQNATDLLVTFTEPSNITKNSNYKVFVVKTADTATFNMAAADAILSGNYKTISTTSSGSSISVPYAVGDKDVNGEDIVACTPYTVFVQSKANQTTANRDVMIKSNSVTILGQVEAVSNIVAQDVFDAADGSDLYFSFDPPSDESNIFRYRIFAVPNTGLATFNLTTAASNPNNVSRDRGDNYFGTFSGTKDSEGNDIVEGKEYTIFVLSLNNGNCVNKDNLAQAASKITLQTILPAKVDNSTIVATDIADANKPSDMQVVFNKPADMTGIGAFHIVVLNSDFASTYNIPSASGVNFVTEEMLKEGYLTKVEIDSDDNGVYKTTLAPYHLDENGERITNNRSYRVFILSEADRITSYKNTISDSSGTVVLRNYTGIEEDLEQFIKVSSFDKNVRITLDPTFSNDGQVVIYNSLGQIIDNRKIIGRENNIELLVERGIYIVNVIVDGKQLSKRVYIN